MPEEDKKAQKELEWKESIEIEDGKHNGTITKVIRDLRGEQKFDYTDVYIKLDDADVELKYGCPSNLSEASKLGKLFVAVGEKPEPGKKVNPEKVLKGKKIQFMTVTNKEGYARIVPDSIKLQE